VSQAVIWISADQRHLPLRIEADTFVGRIFIDLDRGEGREVRSERKS
jgi:hypothetical protein